MNIIKSPILIAAMLLAATATALAKPVATISSPGGNLSLEVSIEGGKPYYSLSAGGKSIVGKSALGFKMRGGEYAAYKLRGKATAQHDDTWLQPWGEDREVRNHYNELTVRMADKASASRTMDIVFRLYDDGLGFRYEGNSSCTVMDELTEFALPAGTMSWSYNAYATENNEGRYRYLPVEQLDTVATPLTLRMADGTHIAIHEAALVDYAKMNLTPVRGSVLKADLVPWSTGEKVRAQGGLQSSWRTIVVGDNAAQLMLSRLMLNLNDPSQIDDTSWIEPGRYIGIWWAIHKGQYSWSRGPKHGATTQNIMRYMDFAARNGFSAVLAEGWNVGWDRDWTTYGTDFQFATPTEDCDIEAIAAYGKKLGVRFIAHNETGGAAAHYEQQIPQAYAMYQRLGFNSVKTGYVNKYLDGKEYHDSQYGVRHYQRVVEQAARHHIMVDAHEPVMPTGLQRTWPNLMTGEAVRGQEYNAWDRSGGNTPTHMCTLPFTRGLAGPMDYTPGVFEHTNPVHPATQPGTTSAAELALSVILYSPLQMTADCPENLEGHPGMEFIRNCPTTWQRTLVPQAQVGECVTVARQELGGNRWFVGAITNEQPRHSQLQLSFLDQGASYKAYIYADGAGAHYKNNPQSLQVSVVSVDASSTLDLDLASGGGAAIMIVKQ